jgi:hypothetical protein
MFQVSKAKAGVWLLLSLSVTVLVTADAFIELHPRAVLPRGNNKRIHSVTQQSDQYNDKDIDENEDSSSAENIPRGGANINQPPPPLPTMAKFRKFALPCLGLWVAQPLLSLVDTAFVGLSGDPASSAAQLAALGPATTFFDGATYLFAFLNVATTNLYSSARAQRGETSDKAESVVRTASRVAWKSGLGMMVFLLAFARPLLALYIGTFLTLFTNTIQHQ